MKKISVKYTILLSLIFAAVFFLIALFFMPKDWKIREEKTYNASSIVEKISFIQELSLVEYHYTSVIGLKSNKKFQEMTLPFTEKSFLATYEGLIKAGIDLQPSDIEILDKNIRLTLPRAKITQHSIDEKTLVIYDESRNILNPIKIEDYNEALKQEKETMEQKAVNSGILTQAEEQAALLLRAFLTEMGFETVEILSK